MLQDLLLGAADLSGAQEGQKELCRLEDPCALLLSSPQVLFLRAATGTRAAEQPGLLPVLWGDE